MTLTPDAPSGATPPRGTPTTATPAPGDAPGAHARRPAAGTPTNGASPQGTPEAGRHRTATAPATASSPQLSHRQVLVIFSGLMLGMFLAALDSTIVTTALPTIAGELGGLDQLSWVVTSYLLASTISTPLCGKLGDLYGRKRLFQVAIVVFLVGSVLCGVAQSMGALIAFRAMQGVGGGGLMVMAQAIIAEVVSPRERGRYQGYFGAVFGTASVGGPLLGGFLTDEVSWRWVFYVNVPVGIVALVVTALRLPASERHGNPRVDYLGACTLAASVTCLVLFTTWGGTQYPWGSPVIVSLGVAALAGFVLLVVVELRAPEPILPIHLVRHRTFRIAVAVSFTMGLSMFAASSFLPLFLQVVNGASATNSGLLLLPQMLGLLTASVLVGQLISRTGRYKVMPVFGSGLVALALFLLSTMGSSTAQGTVTVYMVVLGIGLGSTMQPLVLALQNVVRTTELGAATSSTHFARTMGGAVGVAVFGALFNHLLRDRVGTTVAIGEGSHFTPEMIEGLPAADRLAFIDGFADSLTTVFLYATPLILVAFACTLLLREIPLRTTVHNDGPAPDDAGTLAAPFH